MSELDQPRLDETYYQAYNKHCRSISNHFTFQRNFLLVMSLNEAVFVQDLLNRAAGKNAKVRLLCRRSDEAVVPFFRCSIKFLSRDRNPLQWNKDQQMYLLRKLAKRGFLYSIIIKKAYDNQRWVFIDVAAIHNAIATVQAKRNPQQENEEFIATRGNINKANL